MSYLIFWRSSLKEKEIYLKGSKLSKKYYSEKENQFFIKKLFYLTNRKFRVSEFIQKEF